MSVNHQIKKGVSVDGAQLYCCDTCASLGNFRETFTAKRWLGKFCLKTVGPVLGFTPCKSLRASLRYALRAATLWKLLLQFLSNFNGPPLRLNLTTPDRRSEERRVGKECRSRRSPGR